MWNYKFISIKDISWKKTHIHCLVGRFTIHMQLFPLLWVIVRIKESQILQIITFSYVINTVALLMS